MPDRAGYHAEKHQQAEQWRVFAFHITPGFALRETGCHGKSVARGGQFVLRYRKEGQGTVMEPAIGGQPIPAHLQYQQGLAVDQTQYIAQVITVQSAQGAPLPITESIHQQRAIGRDRIALHQQQLALVVVAGIDLFLIVTEQGTAVNAVVPDQIGRANEGTAGDLFAQGQLDIVAALARQRQQLARGLGGVVEHQFELVHGFLRRQPGTLLQRAFCLHTENGEPQQYRE
ncbi:hypothetical protein D3C84_610940 [compost metagenome]